MWKLVLEIISRGYEFSSLMQWSLFLYSLKTKPDRPYLPALILLWWQCFFFQHARGNTLCWSICQWLVGPVLQEEVKEIWLCGEKAEWTERETCSGLWVGFRLGMENSYFWGYLYVADVLSSKSLRFNWEDDCYLPLCVPLNFFFM